MAASRSFSLVGVFQAQEVQDVGVAKDQVRGDPVILSKGRQLLPNQLFGSAREGRGS